MTPVSMAFIHVVLQEGRNNQVILDFIYFFLFSIFVETWRDHGVLGNSGIEIKILSYAAEIKTS